MLGKLGDCGSVIKTITNAILTEIHDNSEQFVILTEVTDGEQFIIKFEDE